MSSVKPVSGKQPELHTGSTRHEKAALSLILHNDVFQGSTAYTAVVGKTTPHFYKGENQDRES